MGPARPAGLLLRSARLRPALCPNLLRATLLNLQLPCIALASLRLLCTTLLDLRLPRLALASLHLA